MLTHHMHALQLIHTVDLCLLVQVISKWRCRYGPFKTCINNVFCMEQKIDMIGKLCAHLQNNDVTLDSV